MELEDHDRLAIVLGEVVQEQVVDEIAPGTAGDPLPFEVPDVGSPDPDGVVAGAAARAVRPAAELEPIGARTSDDEVIAVPAIEPIRVGIAKQPILAAASDDHLETTQRVALAGRSGVASGACEVDEHATPATRVAEHVPPPAPPSNTPRSAGTGMTASARVTKKRPSS